MTMRIESRPAIPEAPGEAAQAAFRHGKRAGNRRMPRGARAPNQACIPYASREQPGAALWRLALGAVFPFMAAPSDEQAAARRRASGTPDGKSALRLAWTAQGFEAAVLRACRSRLRSGWLWQSPGDFCVKVHPCPFGSAAALSLLIEAINPFM
ncbi:MAG: hypothetical protein U0350_32510 [Caldilineaceae bacterium]